MGLAVLKPKAVATLLFSLAVLAAAAVLYWAWPRLVSDGSLRTVMQAGVLRVGYAIEAPHAFLDARGEVTGLSPELARLVARRMGVERLEWRLAEFGALITELEEGRIDVVAAGMFITPQRARRVAFSEPVFHVRQGLLVKRGNPLGLHSYQDVLKVGAARIAVLSGSVEKSMLLGLGIAEARLVSVPDPQAGLAALESGEADGLALGSPTITWMSEAHALARTEMAQPFVQPPSNVAGRNGYGAFALRKGDRELLRAWNKAQAEVLAGPDYTHLMDMFGFEPEEYPGKVTTQEVAGQ